MEINQYFEKIEKILEIFPAECTKNYYKNKQTLKIIKNNQTPIKSLGGLYDHDTNEIIIYSDESLTHELFHMAFRDKDKVGKKVFEDSDMIYENGVTITKYIGENKKRYGKGITEGFAQYLSRKCTLTQGHMLEYFFTDLLISIYGENIIEYALKNDPKGLLYDDRFFDIFKIITNLDILDETESSIIIVSSFRKIFERKNKSKEDQKKIFKLLDDIINNYKESIIILFKILINEYINCDNPNIKKEEFNNKLSDFLTNPDYIIAFAFDNSKCSVKKEINEIINNFTNNINVNKLKNI